MSIFERDGDAFIPTDAARGPWDPAFLHGGPVAILAGYAVETMPSDQPIRTARLTLELRRPVPVAPLTVESSLLRPGPQGSADPDPDRGAGHGGGASGRAANA